MPSACFGITHVIFLKFLILSTSTLRRMSNSASRPTKPVLTPCTPHIAAGLLVQHFRMCREFFAQLLNSRMVFEGAGYQRSWGHDVFS